MSGRIWLAAQAATLAVVAAACGSGHQSPDGGGSRGEAAIGGTEAGDSGSGGGSGTGGGRGGAGPGSLGGTSSAPGVGGTDASGGMGGRGGTGGSEKTGGTSGQGGATCVFGQEYSFTIPNGTRGYFYRMQASVALTRIRAGSDVGNSCSVPLPACNSPATIDASDIIADIADAEVQLALSTAPRPLYGDRSASSDPTFSFGDTTGAASGGFSVLVGHECSTPTATCEPTPAGVARLVTDVNTVVSAALLDPSCASLR